MAADDADLRAAARVLAMLLRPLERAAGDLTLAQYRVLALVAAGDERSSGLAHRLAVAKPTVTAVVDGLVERGFVAREAVAGDRRSLRLVITRAGRAALDASERDMAAVVDRILGHAADRDTAIRALLDVGDAYRTHVQARLAAKDAK